MITIFDNVTNGAWNMQYNFKHKIAAQKYYRYVFFIEYFHAQFLKSHVHISNYLRRLFSENCIYNLYNYFTKNNKKHRQWNDE